MKAWRQHPTKGTHKNRAVARIVGSIDRNKFFAPGSSLLRALMGHVGLLRKPPTPDASAPTAGEVTQTESGAYEATAAFTPATT